MNLKLERTCDVLVLGSGIAGLSAALVAAEKGVAVILACKGKLFSGSSFYPGTWGLGLIGPADETDEDDLAATIETVGCGMAEDALVRTFVHNIHPAIERVRSMGVQLRRADNGTQKAYIPCFDHKHRDWNGIEFASVKEVFCRRLEELGVTVLSGWEALELVRDGERVCGAVLSDGKALHYVGSKAVVLATGGYGSLFREHLCTSDVEGLGQALALEAGCHLINMEFLQIMAGFLSPAYQTVFNEKVFQYTNLKNSSGEPILDEDTEKLLEMRSTHGPFTSRLPDKAVDLAISAACHRDSQGVVATYSEELRQNTPEFVKTYFDWLAEAKGLSMEDPVYIAPFAHAANGGVWIAPDATTGVPGLLAAGEVTGGMHGADRIGGLSTANGLTFGGIAGRTAAEICAAASQPPENMVFSEFAVADTRAPFQTLQKTMSENALIERSEEGLTDALKKIEGLFRAASGTETDDVEAIVRTRRLRGQLLTAQCILTAALLRKESRGSHFRKDYPTEDPSQASPIVLHMENNGISAHFFHKKA